MRIFIAASIALIAVGCSSAGLPPDGEGNVAQTAEPLTAECQANVRGVGMLDTETVYLPNVVHCENGGAPLESLKAQAIAARTFLYYKLETASSIGDGQGDQVYSCGSAPTAEQKQAVLDTAGLVLRYKDQTIASFYVAGGAANPPACKGGAASTETYVTYNEGLSGSGLHQTTLGFVSATNYRNRGCMSQLGSRCLANEGKTYEDILRFYYGADIVLERATGPCVSTTGLPDAGTGIPAGSGETDAGASHAAHPDLGDSDASCNVSRAGRGSGAFSAFLALAAVAALRRRRARSVRSRFVVDVRFSYTSDDPRS